MKSIIKYIVIFLMLLVNTANAQDALNSYLKTAADNNPGLKSKFCEYMAAMEEVPQVGALPDPLIAFGYFIQPVETRVGPQQVRASLSQMFPWFGLLNAKEDVATEIAKVKYEVFEETRARLFYDVKSAYYNLYFIDKAIDITKNNIDILNTFQKLALIKFEAGLASAVDVLRVEMEVADLENQLAYLNDNKWALQVQFNNLLDVADDNPVIIPDTLWSGDLNMEKDAVQDSIVNQNHLIKQLEFKISSWEKQEVVAKKTGMPDFSVGFDYIAVGKSVNPMLDANESGKDAFLLPKVGITIPLYRKKYSAMVKEAKLQMEAATFQKNNKVNHLSTLFEKGYKNYQDADRRVDLYWTQLELAGKALDILIAYYTTDGKNFEEVLRMERKVLKYQLELDKARADKNAATAFINYLMGK